MKQDDTLTRLTAGVTDLTKRLETLERCIGKLCDCVNDLTVCMEAIPLLDAEEVAEADADYLDGRPFDPAKSH